MRLAAGVADPGPVERGLILIPSVQMVVDEAMFGPCPGSVRGGAARRRDETVHSETAA